MRTLKNIVLVCLPLGLLFVIQGCKCQTISANSDSVYTYLPGSIDGIAKQYYGRQLASVMGASGSEWLERDTRQKEENPRQAIDSMPLAANSVVADIGAGTGYYTFRIAQKIPLGKVYAVEVQDEMITQLESKKQVAKQDNVIIVKGDNFSPNLPANSIDLAIMVDVYHELEYPHEMLMAIRKALKPSGKLLLLEYRAEDNSIPIKPLHKMSVTQANKELRANGFQLYQRKEFLPIQHYLLYKKT